MVIGLDRIARAFNHPVVVLVPDELPPCLQDCRKIWARCFTQACREPNVAILEVAVCVSPGPFKVQFR